MPRRRVHQTPKEPRRPSQSLRLRNRGALPTPPRRPVTRSQTRPNIPLRDLPRLPRQQRFRNLNEIPRSPPLRLRDFPRGPRRRRSSRGRGGMEVDTASSEPVASYSGGPESDIINIIPSTIVEDFEAGAVGILRNMNMLNRETPPSRLNHVLRADNFVDQSPFIALLNQAEARWLARTPIQQLIDYITHLPVGYQLRPSLLNGWTIGLLLQQLRENNLPPNLLSGLYLSGTVYNFQHYLRNMPPQQINLADPTLGFFTPKNVFIRVFECNSIRYFPLLKVYSLKPTYSVPNGSFSDYIQSLQADEGGSEFDSYICWENCTIARTSPSIKSNYVNHTTAICRTAGLGNVLFKTLTYNDPVKEITVYIPKGDSNCFLKCLRKGLYYYKLSQAPSCDQDTRKNIKSITKQMVENLLIHIPKPKQKNVQEEKYGYSTRKLGQIANMCYVLYDVLLKLYYKSSNGTFLNRINLSILSYNPNAYSINLFQLDDMGHFLSSNRNLTEVTTSLFNPETLYSGLTHACLISTTQPIHENIEIMEEIETVCVTHFKTCIDLIHIKSGENFLSQADSVRILCDYQAKRYDGDKTKTLIFENQAKSKYKKNPNNINPPYVVFAYDLETVSNSMDIQELVYEPFKNFFPPNTLYPETLEPIGYQIPFSAQWVPINLFDEGEFLLQKLDKRLPAYDYLHVPSLADTLQLVLQSGPDFIESVGDYILDHPKTEYGDKLLGKCVEDMLIHMAEFSFNNSATVAYAFAHNASGFDNLMVLKYQRFPIKKILKTKRGILSVTINVPIHGGKVHIPIILRDTKLHVPGSLQDLCNGFNVPNAWRKLNFPIDRLTAKICYDPKIIEISKQYGENDVLALAYIIKKINLLIGNSLWRPADPNMPVPPIAQFLTCMSMIRKSTYNHFVKDLKLNPQNTVSMNQLPKCVDLPALRELYNNAVMGGRSTAYAKSYASPYFGKCLLAYMQNNKNLLKSLYQKIRATKTSMITIDATSLYPAAQSSCPMPTGKLHFIYKETACAYIDAVHCDMCDKLKSLCPDHKYTRDSNPATLRPFAIIIVENFRPSKEMRENFRNMVGRKLLKNQGLEYSLETDQELIQRYDNPDIISRLTVMTNIDLYWARRQGYEFDVLSGIAYEVSMVYSSFITPAFQQRIEEKRKGNKLLSNFLKLNYNGAYGITTQKDITETGTIVNVPSDLMQHHIFDPPLQKHILKQVKIDPSEYLTGESFPFPSSQLYVQKKKFAHVAEYYAYQSPNHIGSAVLSYARHIMNLLMFNIPYTHQTYTDTDSICISDYIYSELCASENSIINENFDAPMGTFKNDHAENNGTEPRIIFSLMATKKVKMHITLNQEGEIKIFNTFKGFNPSLNNSSFQKFKPMYAEYICSKTLLALGICGHADPALVTSWKRSLTYGVNITDHIQHFLSKTYLGHSLGLKRLTLPYGNVEFFIPFGCNVPTTFKFNPPSDINADYSIDESRFGQLHSIWCLRDAPLQILSDFIEKYFQPYTSLNWNDVPTEEQEILSTIHNVIEKNQ